MDMENLNDLTQQILTPPNSSQRAEVVPVPVPLPMLVLLLLSTLVFFYMAWPIRVPLFLATVFSVMGQPLYRWVTRKLGGRPRLAGAAMTLFLLVGIVVPAVVMTLASLEEIAHGLAWLRGALGLAQDQATGPVGLASRAVEKLGQVFRLGSEELHSYMSDAAGFVRSTSPQVIAGVLGLFGETFTLLIAFYFLTVDGHFLSSFVGRISPLRNEQTNELLKEFRNVASGAVLGNAANAVLQGVIMFTGFLIFGMPHPIFFGLIAMPAALIPLVGSQLIWVPALFALVSNGRPLAALGLGIWCQALVLIVDNAVKPLILRGKVEFHPGLLLIGFIGGLAMFGLVGLVAGPVAVAFTLTMYRIYQRDYLGRGIIFDRAMH